MLSITYVGRTSFSFQLVIKHAFLNLDFLPTYYMNRGKENKRKVLKDIMLDVKSHESGLLFYLTLKTFRQLKYL